MWDHESVGHEGLKRRDVMAAAGGVLGIGALAATAHGAAAPPADAPSKGFTAAQFGAIGDGVADDTDALQAAIAAAFDADGTGLLVIPPGVYKITRPLHYIQRQNSGRQRRISAYGACLQSAIRDGGHVLHIGCTVYWHFIVIEGLTIRGSGQDGHGLYIESDSAVHSFYNSCLRDLVIEGCGGDGCRLYGNVFESQVVACVFRANRGNGATLAHSLHGGVLSSMQLFGCSFDDNEGHGAEIVRSYDVGFHGCAFQRNGRFGLLATNGCELVLNCRFVDNHRSAYDFNDGGAGMGLRRYATLVGCTSFSTANQTHLIDADLWGSFARLVLVGCTASGAGPAAAAGLARLRGGRAVDATILGCQGHVTAVGFEPLEIGGTEGGIRFSSSWDGANLFRMGDARLWIDSSGRLRLKQGAPGWDGDGAPVGT